MYELGLEGPRKSGAAPIASVHKGTIMAAAISDTCSRSTATGTPNRSATTATSLFVVCSPYLR